MFKKKKIRRLSLIAQSLITDLHSTHPSDDTFDQLGILDGHSTVADFLDHNEWGLALEHVLYMVHESNIDFPSEDLSVLNSLAEKLGVRNCYDNQ